MKVMRSIGTFFLLEGMFKNIHKLKKKQSILSYLRNVNLMENLKMQLMLLTK